MQSLTDLFRGLGQCKLVTGDCDTHGSFQTHVHVNASEIRCPTCMAMTFAQRFREEQAESRKPHLRKITHIPPRYVNCRLANYQPSTPSQAEARKAAVQFVEQFQERQGGLLLIGPVGTGKTHLSTAIAWAVVERHAAHARYTRAAALIEEVRRGYGNEYGITKSGQMRLFTEPRLLVLDELDRVRGTPDELKLLSDVIFARHEAQLPTIAISNSPYPELVQRIGEAEMDRLADGAKVLTVLGDSYRGPIE